MHARSPLIKTARRRLYSHRATILRAPALRIRMEKVMHSKTCGRSIAAALLLMLLPMLSMAQISVGISVAIAPPELPVYVQPPIPAEGYLWTPGYWAWDDGIQDYYWVPGTWIEPPQVGFLWTPGYWGWANGVYLWNAGYWGPHIGFYGGVNYGYGYGGHGYEGGYWEGGHLFYNRAVVNVGSVHITNVYNKTVINNVTVNRVSFSGGSGGVRAQPSEQESAAAHERHIEYTSTQQQHVQAARGNPVLRASANQGHPPIAATARPANFSGSNVVPARHAETTNMARVNTEPHPVAPSPSQPRPSMQPHPAMEPRPALQPAPHVGAAPSPYRAPPVAATPQERAIQSRPPAAVEQHQKPEQTQAARPAPPPQQRPQPQQHPQPQPHPAEDHEHHQP
jgi:hypothetical protein